MIVSFHDPTQSVTASSSIGFQNLRLLGKHEPLSLIPYLRPVFPTREVIRVPLIAVRFFLISQCQHSILCVIRSRTSLIPIYVSLVK
jgi:hypothetical protein